MKKVLSPYIFELLNYLKALFVVRLGESENVEAPEKADVRISLLKNGEETLRNSLKSLSTFEEILYVKDKIEVLEMKKVDIP